MEFSRISARCREALSIAQAIAVQRGHEIVETEHFLLALLNQPNGLAPYLMAQSDSGVEKLTCLVEMRLARVVAGVSARTYLGAEIESLFTKASREAKHSGSSEVALGHVLIVLAEEETQYGEFLRAHGVTRRRILCRGRALDGIPSPTPSTKKVNLTMLEAYGRDLTAEAALGRFEPALGRDDTVREMMKLLLCRSKNNLLLVGEPGVGKTTTVETLATLVARGDVPEPLREKTIVAVDFGAMVAGAQHRGIFEGRVRGAIAEAESSKGRVILFVEDAQALVRGATGATPGVAPLLEPALARASLRVIAAATPEAYRRYFARHPAFSRQFQPVFLDEPDVAQTVAILRRLRPRLEAHHGVRIEDEAVRAAASFSARIVVDRGLPDKAIDLLDEAAAERRLECDRLPKDLERLETRVVELEVRRESRLRAGEPEEPGAPDELAELAELRTAAGWLRARWQFQREQYEQVRHLRASLESPSQSSESDAATRAGLAKKLMRAEAELANASNDLIRERVGKQDIAKLVARSSGLSAAWLLEDEARKLVSLEERLRDTVVGQPRAIRAVAGAILRVRTSVSSTKRTAGCLLFSGPRGVGKTVMAKALARHLYGDESALFRVSTGQFSRPGSASGLVTTGHEEGGLLAAVRRRPHSVVVFDEIDAAPHDLEHLLIEILDRGRITDSRGRVLDFRHVLMILTSRAGQGDDGGGAARTSELFERCDAVVAFRSLAPEHVLSIVERQADALVERVSRLGTRLHVTEGAKRWLAARGYDPDTGALPLRRLIENEVEGPLAKRMAIRSEGEAFPAAEALTVAVEPGGGGLRLEEESGEDPSDSDSDENNPSSRVLVPASAG